MSNFYNVFGQFVSTQTIETFVSKDDKIDNTKILNNIKVLKVQIENGTITKEQIITEIEKLNSLKLNKDTSDEVKNAIESLVKNTVSKVDGIRLAGNMELTGIMKSRGFYLTDGTKVNEVTRVVDKLALPLDKDGHLTILPPKGKRVKANVHDLNIAKSGRITFGDKEDNDPYHLRKVGDADNNHLRLSLNDNNNESLQIWGDSCKTDKCTADGGTFKHGLYSDGNAKHTGDIIMNGGNNWIFHTPDDKRHSLYISPSTTLGKEDWKWSNGMELTSKGEVVIKNAKDAVNPTGLSTHFNHQGKSHNYIRGKTEIRGETNFVDGSAGINITNKKNANNPTGGGTHFNYKGNGLNYIRGKTQLKGDVNIIGNVNTEGKICINKTCITEKELEKLIQHQRGIRYIQLGNTDGNDWDRYWSIGEVRLVAKNGANLALKKPVKLIKGTPYNGSKVSAITDNHQHTNTTNRFYHSGGKNERTLLEIDLGKEYKLDELKEIQVMSRWHGHFWKRQIGTHVETLDSNKKRVTYSIRQTQFTQIKINMESPRSYEMQNR